MSASFIIASETPEDVEDWGRVRGLSGPVATAARDLTVLQVTLAPGKGHDFHKHPRQEEVIYVVSGRVEQWVGEEKRLLGPGDAAFIEAGGVHASFNTGSEPARVVAILGPCQGQTGYEVVDVAGEAPWNGLRR